MTKFGEHLIKSAEEALVYARMGFAFMPWKVLVLTGSSHSGWSRFPGGDHS
jgi:hypothetical protein